MDKKALFINFLVTFVASFLAISLFMFLHRPPRMIHPGEFQGGPQPMQQGQMQPQGQQFPPQTQMPAPCSGQQVGPQQPGQVPMGQPTLKMQKEQGHAASPQTPMPEKK